MVLPEVAAQLSRPIIGHHTVEFRELMAELRPRLQYLLATKNPVFTFTCTASATMEAALQNAGGDSVLILSNGLFGERWALAARALSIKATVLDFGWGKPCEAKQVAEKLNSGRFNSLVMVHGETSTGMLNSLETIQRLLAMRPEITFIVDAVTTLGGVPIFMDDMGIDVLVGGSQKCLALPPGIVPVGVSQKALKRSLSSRRKGYAGDFDRWQERWQENEVVATPAIPQLYALHYQLGRIAAETLEARRARHRALANLASEWAEQKGWGHFSPEGFRLPPVSCLVPRSGQKTEKWVAAMRDRGYLIDAGRGKLQGQVLRIGHLGDWQEGDLHDLLNALSEVTADRQ